MVLVCKCDEIRTNLTQIHTVSNGALCKIAMGKFCNQKSAEMTYFVLETNNSFDFEITCLQMTMIKQTSV